MDLITCLLRNSELEIHFTCKFKAQIKYLQLHQMMHHMVSQLTRFNLHIRVKGRRNVQGSEQIKKFLTHPPSLGNLTHTDGPTSPARTHNPAGPARPARPAGNGPARRQRPGLGPARTARLFTPSRPGPLATARPGPARPAPHP